jgi:hypothetical protein
MNSSLLRSITILLLLIAGCRPEAEVAPSVTTVPTTPQATKPVDSSDTVDPPEGEQPPDSSHTSDSSQPPDSSDPPGVIVYTTGEDIDWPSIPPPLMEISFDLPEVPEHILGPFSEDILPAEE